MQRPGTLAVSPTVLRILVLALASAALSALVLRHGLWATPDSWGYWEGSISLLERGHYTYLDGRPVIAWPPLFAAYLAAIQAVVGQTGTALIVAMVGIVFFNALSWLAFVETYRAVCGDGNHWQWSAVASGFVVLFLPLQLVRPLAHCLWLAWIGLAFTMALRIRDAPDRGTIRLGIGLGVTLCLALLTHNTTVIFIPGLCFLFMAWNGNPFRTRVLACAWMIGLSLPPWIIVRAWCGQLGSHSVGVPVSRPWEYLEQTMLGLGRYFVEPLHSTSLLADPGRQAMIDWGCGLLFVAFVAFALLDKKEASVWPVRAPLLLATGGYGFLFLIFCVVPIWDQLWGRFLWFVPLACVPPLCRHIARSSRSLALVTLSGLLLVQAYGFRVQGPSGAVPPMEQASHHGARLSFLQIHPCYFLTGRSDREPPPGFVRIDPPTFKWQWRWNPSESEGSQECVVVR